MQKHQLRPLHLNLSLKDSHIEQVDERAYMYTTLKCLGKRVIQTNPSKFDERLFSDIYLCKLHLKQRNTCFYMLRQGVPEGRSSEGYASFK